MEKKASDKVDKDRKLQELQAEVVGLRTQAPIVIGKLMDKEFNIFVRNLHEQEYVMDNPLHSLPADIKVPSYVKKVLEESPKTFNLAEKDIELNARTDDLLHCLSLMKKKRKKD